MTIPIGLILYEGPSPLNDQPIVVIMTLYSRNGKTGNMGQTWTILQDDSPLTAVYSGTDSAICGSCIHRGVWDAERQRMVRRTCYVDVSKSVQNVWYAYKRDRYPHIDSRPQLLDALLPSTLRWGAYGEAVLIPQELFERISTLVPDHTGYTHLWRDPRFQWAKAHVHASCDSLADEREATAAGWIPYTVIPPEADPPPNTRQCPATLPNSLVQCRTCLGCSGTAGKSAWTPAHGRGAKYFAPS